MNHVLLYACRNCEFQTETVNPCVFKHDLLVVARCASGPPSEGGRESLGEGESRGLMRARWGVCRETAGVTQDLETDPTLVSWRVGEGCSRLQSGRVTS